MIASSRPGRMQFAAVSLALTVLAGAIGWSAIDSAAAPSAAATIVPTAASAAPADARFVDFVAPIDTALVVRQPDGTEIRAQMTPAEIGGALEVDGFSIVKSSDGWWRYAAKRALDGLVASDARVGLDPRPAGVGQGIGRTASVYDDGNGGDVRTELYRQIQTASRRASLEAAAAGGPRVFRFPVVLFATWYDPDLGQTAPQFQEGNTVEHYTDILDGFGGNPTGTLTEFYFENSYGQFLVEVDVLAQPDGTPYVSNRSSVPGDEGRCYYGGIDPPEDPLDDLDPLDYVIGAGGGGALGMGIELMNTTTLPLDHDFSKYDNDGDLSIDFMGIIHTGAEMAVTGDPCNTWSHAISVSTFTALAGTLLQDFGLPVPDTGFKAGLPVPGQAVTYDRLFTMPEFETRDGTLTIGVAAHEMAHALGEPDYYGTDGSTSGSGDWDIMSGGSYGGTPSGSNPTWFNPASRVFQGWVTPTIVDDDRPDYTFQRRSSMPAGYTVDQPNPNLVLVPTRWIDVGETTEEDGHTWTENDVYGLPRDGDNGYVIEGWYLEFGSRMPVRSPGIHADMTRESYFDRWLYGSGLLTWHFDYWRRSNVLFGQNGANNDANRMQMDVEEWDFNDNTQEIGLNRNRAEASDVVWGAATGITSGTHRNSPSADLGPVGDPQGDLAIPSGPVTPLTPYDFVFEVDDNPANRTMRVEINTDLIGDCTLQLLRGPEGSESPETEVVDAGFALAPETAIVTRPKPGRWVARIGDFAACGSASGSISFESPSGFDATGTADTWSNATQEPTGWAFTDVRTGEVEGLSHGSDAGGADTLTVDILNLAGSTDFSPGFVTTGAGAALDGRLPLNAGTDNPMAVRIFSNGDGGGAVPVSVRVGSPDGTEIASGTVELGGYDNDEFTFTWDPGAEGPVDLYTVVDAAGTVSESVEDNNVQKATLWAGPADPTVLIVDDDGPGDAEQVYAGALAALGIPYAIADKHVTAGEMAGYDAVIWQSTLDRNEGPVDEADRKAIAEYLGDGGNLWMSSNRAIQALTAGPDPDFARTWFGVESIDIDSFYVPVTMETTDILGTDGLSIEALPGRPFVDKYALADSPHGTSVSLGVLQGSGTADDGTAVLGARLDGDGFKSVASAFNLMQVGDPDDAIGFVAAVMDHFGVTDGQYTVTGADPIVYHAQPRQSVSGVDLPIRAIVLGGTAGQPVQVFQRHHGLGELVPLDMAPAGTRGGYRTVIPGADVTPDGIDYHLKAGAASTYVPRAAENGALANAVAVFLPEVDAAPATPGDPAAPPAEAPTPPTPTLPATGSNGAVLLLLMTVLTGIAVSIRFVRGARGA
ncbi:immune inhibitor A domain-containing protein [Actinospongicola halichondriae]|uniref:immune inhibitor A domain-containing protein n=1 Tax=Actinospongicola halichondriae TaxID=3236844 RepID=UPI003D52D12D